VDLKQRVDRAEGDGAGADQLLAGFGEREDLRAGTDELACLAQRLRGAVQGVALVEHRLLCEAARYLKLASSCGHRGDERPVLLRITAGTVGASWIR
jgi:hypothetical protein